ncbi:hypothetical protein [Methylobacter sp.]|uniref:hypothetical protein n=1 Tax=Methylobacter sp. TaxID=2051955 RepID=UPI0025EC4786|nr:hypothetical protein [Methylobacter sp.]
MHKLEKWNTDDTDWTGPNGFCLIPTQLARRYTQVFGRYDGFRHPGRDCRDPEAMDGNIEAGTSLAARNCLVKSGIHIPVLWFPAIPAGMTCFSIFVHEDERGSAWEQKREFSPAVNSLRRS